MNATTTAADPASVVTIDTPDAPGPFVLVCEHAAAHIPAALDHLGLTPVAQRAHIAWDPGALGLAQALATRLAAPLVHAGVSRLVYDLNRPPHAPGAMPATSEIFDIPGNADLTPEDRLARTEAFYLPFHAALRDLLARRLARGMPTILVTVHSFTPVWFGTRRAVELGVIHDAQDRFARAVTETARAATDLDVRMNEPYCAADGVTHTLALHATPLGLDHVMLEVRNDLLETGPAQTGMADRLAPVLQAARRRLEKAEAAPAGGSATTEGAA